MNLRNLFHSGWNHIPTSTELEQRYGFYDKFPYGINDYCCGMCDGYVMDFITHRTEYHKISINQAMKELDDFISEIVYWESLNSVNNE